MKIRIIESLTSLCLGVNTSCFRGIFKTKEPRIILKDGLTFSPNVDIWDLNSDLEALTIRPPPEASALRVKR